MYYMLMYTAQAYKTKKEIGRAGESFIKNFLISRGYTVYKTNITRWGSEIDLVVYKLDHVSNRLEIRLVEVKTRSSGFEKTEDLADLSYFKVEHKVRKYKALCVDLGESIVRELASDSVKIHIRSHIDLAIVRYQLSNKGVVEPYLKKYIQNVNLLI